jgi:hypothetical protein
VTSQSATRSASATTSAQYQQLPLSPRAETQVARYDTDDTIADVITDAGPADEAPSHSEAAVDHVDAPLAHPDQYQALPVRQSAALGAVPVPSRPPLSRRVGTCVVRRARATRCDAIGDSAIDHAHSEWVSSSSSGAGIPVTTCARRWAAAACCETRCSAVITCACGGDDLVGNAAICACVIVDHTHINAISTCRATARRRVTCRCAGNAVVVDTAITRTDAAATVWCAESVLHVRVMWVVMQCVRQGPT